MKSQKHKKHKPKIGLALGGGSAKGLAHIGVLKVLEKHHIPIHYIAGTSIGAIIGALYASGHCPKEIEEIAKTTNWKKIVDFTKPKSGLIKGQQIENKLKKLIKNKNFKNLKIPLRVVAIDINTRETVIFSRGNIAKAVHASAAIPGIFNPVKIRNNYYIDGGWADPTPFDVVKDMGADIIIAVDLSQRLKVTKGPEVEETTLFHELKKKFIAEELLNLREWLTPRKFPQFIIRLFEKLFDKILYPQKILKMLAKREHLPIIKIIRESNNILSENLAKEKLKNAKLDFLISPEFGHLTWSDFNKVNEFIQVGETAARKILPKLKKKLMR